MTTETVKVLKKAVELLKKRGGWAQGCYAYDKDGRGVVAENARAVSFCAAGAVRRAGHDLGMPVDSVDSVSRAIDVLEDFLPSLDTVYPLVQWNDTKSRKKEEVIELFRAAIKAEAKR